MKLCEICQGEKRRPKGHSGRHTGSKLGGHVRKHIISKPQVYKPRRYEGELGTMCESLASKIAALDSKREKLAKALVALQEL